MLEHGGSVGQSLLGIRYSAPASWRILALAAADILGHYAALRQMTLLQLLPGAERTKLSILHWLGIVMGG